jgi:hypothetical protein
MKWEYITLTWQLEWITDAKASVVQFWKRYRPSTGDSSAFISWKYQQSARRADNIDEYFRYIREPPVPHSYIKQGVCS